MITWTGNPSYFSPNPTLHLLFTATPNLSMRPFHGHTLNLIQNGWGLIIILSNFLFNKDAPHNELQKTPPLSNNPMLHICVPRLKF